MESFNGVLAEKREVIQLGVEQLPTQSQKQD